MPPQSPVINPIPKWRAIVALTRLDRPIGIELLLWPTLWSLWIAAAGSPAILHVVLFTLGVVLMRSAGCAINDFADRKVDGLVVRTAGRPLAAGLLSAREAVVVFAVLVAASALLLLGLPVSVFYWSFGALFLATLYPFMKRFTYLPQLVLGAAFSWAIPMAFVTNGQDILPSKQGLSITGWSCWLLYCANLCWTVAYDTYYAMADREEDIPAGIKSTAILFDRWDLAIIALLNGVFLGLMATVYVLNQLSVLAYLGLLLAAGLMLYQGWRARKRVASECFWAFLHNRWVGRLVWLLLIAGYLGGAVLG